MTRSELIQRIAAQFPLLTEEDAEAVVSTILAAIANRLAEGERVEIRGFGSFSAHYRPPRTGRNPRTGAQVPVPAKIVPRFIPGTELRERVAASVTSAKPGAGTHQRTGAGAELTPVA